MGLFFVVIAVGVLAALSVLAVQPEVIPTARYPSFGGCGRVFLSEWGQWSVLAPPLFDLILDRSGELDTERIEAIVLMLPGVGD